MIELMKIWRDLVCVLADCDELFGDSVDWRLRKGMVFGFRNWKLWES
ncbi:hypothetical protein Hanom_Chr08g00724151 [Helianthus anomalus]